MIKIAFRHAGNSIVCRQTTGALAAPLATFATHRVNVPRPVCPSAANSTTRGIS